MGNTSSKEEVNLLLRIGEGSYAVVYKAVWKNRQVAAKKLHSYLLGKTDVKQKFREEWELLSGLNHPNIVKYLTAVIPESPRESTIIVTELLDQDLRRFIMTSQTKPKVTFRDTVSIMLDVAEGLNYLHQLPTSIVHRDLACKNILLTVTNIRGGSTPRSNPLPFYIQFFRKGTPFVYLLLEKGNPFIYLLKKT